MNITYLNLKNTVKLPATRPPVQVPCTHCDTLHTQNTQRIVLEHLGDVHYDACCVACEQVILDTIARRLSPVATRRPIEIMLIKQITNMHEYIYDLKQLISEWQSLIHDLSRTGAVVKYKIWQANYQELSERTAHTLKKENK